MLCLMFLTSPDSVLFSEPKGYVASSCAFPFFLPLGAEEVGERVMETALCLPGLSVQKTHGTNAENQDPAASS